MSVGRILQHFAKFVLSNEIDGNPVNFQCYVYRHLDCHGGFLYSLPQVTVIFIMFVLGQLVSHMAFSHYSVLSLTNVCVVTSHSRCGTLRHGGHTMHKVTFVLS